MSQPRIDFVAYRWGDDLLGGAEVSHRHFVRELADAGATVRVLTTTAGDLRPFRHWGVRWEERFTPEVFEDDGVRVERFAIQQAPIALDALRARSLQLAHEREVMAWDPGRFLPAFEGAGCPVHLLAGWHHPEPVGGGRYGRWTTGRATMAVRPAGGELVVAGQVPRRTHVAVRIGGEEVAATDTRGAFELRAPLPGPGGPAVVAELVVRRPARPARDFRTLGAFVWSVWVNGAEAVEADMARDFRALGRSDLAGFQRLLVESALARPERLDRTFLHLRGPVSRGLAGAVRASRADAVIHANLPWWNVGLVRPGDDLLAFWHIDDDYYFWRPFINAARRARLVLAATPYSAGEFFPSIGASSLFVGPPVWYEDPDPVPSAEDILAWRGRHGLGRAEQLVLAVGRREPSKRMDDIAASVARMRDAGMVVRFVGVGPGESGTALPGDGLWLGRLDDRELDLAYRACDVLCFLSESESFGIVVPEAWRRGKPVVVNRHNAATASLVRDGADGLLAMPGAELDAALGRLLGDGGLATRLGRAGQEKARTLFHRGAAAERYLRSFS